MPKPPLFVVFHIGIESYVAKRNDLNNGKISYTSVCKSNDYSHTIASALNEQESK